jgi:hypothetical protein
VFRRKILDGKGKAVRPPANNVSEPPHHARPDSEQRSITAVSLMQPPKLSIGQGY